VLFFEGLRTFEIVCIQICGIFNFSHHSAHKTSNANADHGMILKDRTDAAEGWSFFTLCSKITRPFFQKNSAPVNDYGKSD
jgi:hypothetical protein